MWAESSNELPSHYFKTDLVRKLAPGNPARSFEINTFRECLNTRDGRFLKSSTRTPRFTDGSMQRPENSSHSPAVTLQVRDTGGPQPLWFVHPLLTKSDFCPRGGEPATSSSSVPSPRLLCKPPGTMASNTGQMASDAIWSPTPGAVVLTFLSVSSMN